jgi:hypothetical protein
MSKRHKSVKSSEKQRTGCARTRKRAPAGTDLAAAIHALVADVSDEEWKKLPPNLASRVDELLYDRDK